MNEKTRYTDEELKEFEEIILNKLEIDLESIKVYLPDEGNGTSGTENRFKGPSEEGKNSLTKKEKEDAKNRLSAHISLLNAALIRIKKKTYGICRETGKLISKERLRAVPHATLSIDAKNNQK